MKLLRYIFILLTMVVATWQLSAQTAADSVYYIVDEINDAGAIMVTQPESLAQRLYSDTDIRYVDNSKVRSKDRGDDFTRYSVQIFSENKGQPSKKNAEYRKRMVEQRMPGMRARIDYDTPYWKVRVGSFRTEAEARVAERDIKSKFPSFAGEVRIVRLRVK